MSSPEEKAYEIMRELDVSYVLVIFGGLTGYSSDGKPLKQRVGQLHVKNRYNYALRIVTLFLSSPPNIVGEGFMPRLFICSVSLVGY